ncbi:hypothetical protein SDC9_183104 [bioreactor metagenome]|uniref:Uncharacterized protein n=1 Tax=bioreactor metagenome TaxID=1076179 RepID=A0A645HAR3_9ZZZZ
MENETTASAEFVIPLSSIVESEGTVLSSDGTSKEVVQAFASITGNSNYEMFEKIAELLNAKYKENKETVEPELYVPTLDSNDKNYVIYDTVEKSYIKKLKENCVKVQ